MTGTGVSDDLWPEPLWKYLAQGLQTYGVGLHDSYYLDPEDAESYAKALIEAEVTTALQAAARRVEALIPRDAHSHSTYTTALLQKAVLSVTGGEDK